MSSFGEVGSDRVCSVAVEVVTPSVVTPGGSRVGMTGEVLNVSERHPSVEGCGDGRVAQRVRADALTDTCRPRQATNDAGCVVAVETCRARVQEQRPGDSISKRGVQGCHGSGDEGDRGSLSALARHSENLVPALGVEVFDVG
jgi:hypothetical protein